MLLLVLLLFVVGVVVVVGGDGCAVIADVAVAITSAILIMMALIWC